MKRIILIAILALAGCADLDQAPATYWRANSTDEDLQRDLAACRMQAAMLPNQPAPYQNPNPNDPGVAGQALANLGQSMTNASAHQSFFSDCMRSKGWVQTNG
jgi:hypothetical protein